MYENKKKEIRKVVAAEKRETFKTGGGLPESVPKKEVCDEILLSIMNKKSVYGIESVYDSDGIVIEKNNNTNVCDDLDETVSEEHINFIIDEVSDESNLDEVCV